MKDITLATLLTFSVVLVGCGKDGDNNANQQDDAFRPIAQELTAEDQDSIQKGIDALSICTSDQENLDCTLQSTTKSPALGINNISQLSESEAERVQTELENLLDRAESENKSLCKKVESGTPHILSDTVFVYTYVCATSK